MSNTMGESQQHLTSLNFDKLNLDNFHTWKFSMKMFLIGKGLWEIVDGTETVAHDASEELKAKFKKRDNLALATICLGINSDLHIYVRGSKAGNEAWDALSKRFEEKTLSKKISYRRKLYKTHMNPGTDMTTHINDIKTISEHLEAVEDPVDEKDLVMILISSWPSEYNNLITTLETLSDDKLTWNYVRDRAIAEYDRMTGKRNCNSKDTALNTDLAGFARGRGRGRDFGRGRGRGHHNRSNTDKRTCHHCHEMGHFVRNCPRKKEKQDSEDAKVAVVKVGQFDDRNDDEYALISNTNEGQLGQVVDVSEVGSSPISNVNEGQVGDGDDDVEYALEVNTEDVSQIGNCSENKHWWLDSGCSRHMTPSKKEFKNYLQFKTPVNVSLADETIILGYGIGNIQIKLFDGNEFVPVVIKNVLYVPKLQRKLLSITDITDRGSSITFEGKICTLKLKDKNFLFGRRYGKLWRLHCQEEECFFSSVGSFRKKEASMSLWHQRYGHLSHGNLDVLNRKDMVEGLTFDSKVSEKSTCEGCIMGKHHRTPFPKQSSRVTRKPLELIHSDVCGPISVPSISGSRYFITFIDDYTQYLVTYMMKNKDEALPKFKEYVAMAETLFGYKVIKVRTDNGGEYVSKVFDDFLKERGTQDEHTVPYSPQQNGTAERSNRTLMEKVRSMLYHSNLPLRFWAEALATATYVKNRSPTSTLEETPYERWNGTKPDVSNLRVFGCKAYAHVPDEKRKKLDKKSQKCIFVGYPKGVKGYKLFNPVTRKMLVSRDVIFVENVFDHSVEKNEEPDELLPAICFGFDDDETREYRMEIANNDDDDDDHNNDAVHDDDNDDVIHDVDDDDNEGDDDDNEGDEEEDVRQRPRRNAGAPQFYGKIASHRFGKWEDLDQANVATIGTNDPKSFSDAMAGPNSLNWKSATDAEMASLSKNDTWDLVDLPAGKSVIGSKWVLKTKMNPNGTINKYKGRLVAQGYSQKHGVNYDEVFAPVVKYVSLRTVLAIANQYDMEVHQMDVNSAYLNGDIDAEIYIKQPEGYIDPDNPRKVCKLRKSLYGLKQSARCWNEKIDNFLKSEGYCPKRESTHVSIKPLSDRLSTHRSPLDLIYPRRLGYSASTWQNPAANTGLRPSEY